MFYLRLRATDEVRIFLLEQESVERHKQLIETQKTLIEQVAAFLPKEIYQRVQLDIAKGLNPISAVDNQLRPRKIIGSVLFTDIRGFTNLTKQGDQILLEKIIPAQKTCTDIVENHRGIPRLQGDLVYAYYDSEDPIENIIRSLQSAFEIDLVTRNLFNRTLEGNILRYIIVSFGSLLVGNLGGTNGSRDISVLGNAANIPSRIDSATKNPMLASSLIDAHVILTTDAWNYLPTEIQMILEHNKFDLATANIVLRDFETESVLYLIKSKSDYLTVLDTYLKSRETGHYEVKLSNSKEAA